MKKAWFIGLFFFLSHSYAQVEAYDLGTIVNNFTATDTEGNTIDLYEQCDAGKYVFIKFYLSSCSYCQYITPFFNELYEKYGCNSGDLACISVNGFADNTGVASFEAAYSGGFSHPNSISTDGGSVNIINRFIPNSYPTVCIIAPDRTIVNLNIWPISSVEDLEAAFPEGFFPMEQTCTMDLDTQESHMLKIVPNPSAFHSNIIIESNEIEHCNIEIYDSIGKQMTQFEVQTNQPIPLNIPIGMYFIKIIYNNNSQIKTLLIN